MSQFNAPKNPPWVRSDNFSVPQITQPAIHQQMLTPQMSPVVQYQQSPGQPTATVYQAQLALQQQALNMQQTMQQNIQQLANTQIYNPQISAVTAVPNRNLNAAAFAQPVVAPNTVNANAANTPPSATTTGTKQRVFTGIVTKVLDTYGFVDEDVFFQLSVVKGPTPVVNDRVLVEAVCLPNMPFKWNATRIQVLPMNDQPRNSKKGFVVSSSSSSSSLDRGNYTAVPPPEYDDSRRDRDRDRDRRRARSRERNRRSPLPSSRDDDDRKRRERRERDEKEKEREKERERARSRSPKKPPSRPQVVKKYRVRVPEFLLDVSYLLVCDLRTRYHQMYIPSDFFRVTPKWQDTFPPNQPMNFTKTAQFHVMSKEVDPVIEYTDTLEPTDADYLYCAKVMLLSMPTKDVMMKKCMQLTEELDKDDRNLVHPSRLINCVVGANTRGKNEFMAIGGPWSPSLDGADPAGDPNVLIKTAIRTCRALTGVDLTPCTHWYRFAEIYYHRSKSTHKGKQIPARVETVVIYVPDVWSAMPSCLEWDGLHLNLKKQLDKKLVEAGKDQTEVAPDDEKVEGTTGNQKEPTHYSQLDLKVMKVSELRDELEARNMNSKGLRLQLLARLSKVLKTEQESAEQEDKNNSTKPSSSSDKDKESEDSKREKEGRDKKKSDSKGKAVLEERYALPESPHILMFPSRTAKSGKFTCKVMSLSLLLDYSSDVSKEHTFEVSLFAELFNEMLMRDFGMQVYRAIHEAPDVEEKEETDRKDEKDKKEEKEDKDKKEKENKDDDKDKKEKSAEKTKDEEKDKKTDKKEEKEEKKSEERNVNGNEREGSHSSSDDDDSVSRDSSNPRKDRRDDRRDRKRKETVPQYTAYPDLLLAFTYFDVTRYGRISGTHLEDLIHVLGLQLSRSQVKKLVGKVLYREYCDYRKLTDLPVGTTPPEKTSEHTVPLELGNKTQLPVFQVTVEKKESPGPPAKRGRRAVDKEPAADKPSEGFVYYKGALVNIDNLNEEVARNENARLKTEEKLTELKEELNELREKSKKSSDEAKSLQKELKSCKSKLSTTSEKLNHQVASSDVYLSALMDIEERLVPILDTDEIRRLIKIRQSVSGAPTINLVPLTKVEEIPRYEELDEKPVKTESKDDKKEKGDKKESPSRKDVKKEKPEHEELEVS